MAQGSQSALLPHGLRYWMQEVLVEADKARDGFRADPVHDLRVAIRRCRSMAEGFASLDPDPAWKKMREAAKPLFSALGDLRDLQVQMEWIEKLGAGDDPVRARLMTHFQAREHDLKSIASQSLAGFDAAQWKRWTSLLDERSQQLPPGGEVFQVMALERWHNARQLQSAALRNRSKTAWHALRIGIKKLRYIVENFLPDLHQAWSKDLKKLQDLLGEVHDLDVLWDTALAVHALENPAQRKQWFTIVQRERRQRIEAYRAGMLGKQSLWHEWRSRLPQGDALHAAVLKMFSVWSSFRDPDVAHSQHVLAISQAIFGQLPESAQQFEGVTLRDLLTVAVLAHEVGRGQEGKHHKQVPRLLNKLEPPPGWSPQPLQIAGLVARYHRGSLPQSTHKNYAALSSEAKRVVNLLAGVIRLADALARALTGAPSQVKVIRSNSVFIIRVPGYRACSPKAERIAASRHLLETATGLPILVRHA